MVGGKGKPTGRGACGKSIPIPTGTSHGHVKKKKGGNKNGHTKEKKGHVSFVVLVVEREVEKDGCRNTATTGSRHLF